MVAARKRLLRLVRRQAIRDEVQAMRLRSRLVVTQSAAKQSDRA
ncbi:MAG: hypothetical protein ACKOCN_03875 [Planctomycetaceae bacterium]